MRREGIALVAHSGGPTAVINASLLGIVEESRDTFKGLYGARYGLEGVLSEEFIDLHSEPTELMRQIGNAPSSALGTSRLAASDQDLDRIIDVFKKHEVRVFFYTGGNGSMGTAQQIQSAAADRKYDLQVIGVPKTIDNDLFATDHTPGFPSTARFFASALRDIGADNLALRNQVEIVEILGRNAGWLAASTALARHHGDDAPHLIYFPETRLSLDTFLADVERVFSRLNRCVVAVCEGQLNDQGEPFGADVRGGSRGSLAQNLAHRLATLTTQHLGLRARSEKPGLLGRCCGPFALQSDRDEAKACGQAAVRIALAGQSGVMVTLHCDRDPYRYHTGSVSFSDVAFRERTLPVEYRSPSGNDVTPAFVTYAAPLIGMIQPYACFRRLLSDRNLT